MSVEPLPESSELAKLVGEAKSDLPDAEALARVFAKLPTAPPPAAAPPAAAPAAGISLGAKIGIATLVLAGGAALLLSVGPGGWGAAGAPQVVVSAAPAASPSQVQPASPVASGESNVETPAEPSAAPTPSVDARRPRLPPTLRSEAQLLEHARRDLAHDPAKALAATREHKRLYPNGVLSQERDVIAIEALKRLKRDAEAKSRAAQFEKDHPESAHQKKVESVVKP